MFKPLIEWGEWPLFIMSCVLLAMSYGAVILAALLLRGAVNHG